MIFADKLAELRKKAGWSQEELAQKLNVSRQAVSKWEGAQSVPDLDRIVRLSGLFGVSTDYLLKEEEEQPEYVDAPDDATQARRVSMEEANAFLSVKADTADRIAWAAFACILSPVALLMLGALADTGRISESAAAAAGLAALLVMVAGATAAFISCGMKTGPYAYLEKEPIETEYGVSGMVRERRRRYREQYKRDNVLGACVCILSVLPLLSGAFFFQDVLGLMAALAATIVIAGIGVTFFIRAGIRWESMEKLLEEGDYSREAKRNGRCGIGAAYWLTATAVYLGYSFVTNDWRRGWIMWPVAGVLYAALMSALGARRRR